MLKKIKNKINKTISNYLQTFIDDLIDMVDDEELWRKKEKRKWWRNKK